MISSIQFGPQITPVKLPKTSASRQQGLAQLRHDTFVSSTSFGESFTDCGVPSSRNYSYRDYGSYWQEGDYGDGEFVNYPMRFKPVERDVLYRGGEIVDREQLDNLVNLKGIRSIISFLSARHSSQQIENEAKLVNRFNIDNPLTPISHVHIDFYKLSAEGPKALETAFAKAIKENPGPIYMHCIAGKDICGDMEQMFRRLVKDGKIQLAGLRT